MLNYRAMKVFRRPLIPSAITSGLVALALTALLYGDTLALPLFSDDLVQIPWLESISWRELWTTPSPYGYYRPLWYTLWRVWGPIPGDPALLPWKLHLLNLIAHVAAAWTTGLFVVTWMHPGRHPSASRGERVVAAALSTAIFALFPFSRQAVAWPGAVYNPMVSAMAAGALLAYDRGRRGRGVHWIGLALLLALLAPLIYESGMLVGPLVAFAEVVGWLKRRWPHRTWWPLVFIGLFLLILIIWRAMRGAGITGFGLNPADLWHNASYLVQGLTYPTAPLAQRLVAWRGIDSRLALWIVALPTLALLTWSALRENSGVFWLGAGWFALLASPPLVSMEADWFALAPRFLYTTAAGISLIWTAALSAWIARLRSVWRLALAGVVITIALTPAATFVRDGMRLYRMSGESIWGAAQAASREHPVLLVNLPRRIRPNNRIYPLGFEGVTPLPMRVTAEGLAYVHIGLRDAANAVAFGIIAADQPEGYSYQLFGQTVGWEEMMSAARQARAVHLTRYKDERIYLVEAGAVEGKISRSEPVARFGDRVNMLDAIGTCDEDGHVHVIAHWQVEEEMETDATVFVHLLRSDGTVVAQADGYPLLGMLPFWLWERGEVVRDVRSFASTPPGEYAVKMGIWDVATGERWPADAHPDGVVTLTVQCP